jgi:hypothetical protein
LDSLRFDLFGGKINRTNESETVRVPIIPEADSDTLKDIK